MVVSALKGMAMRPDGVAKILLSLVTLTTTLYYFSPPKSIARGKASKAGIYGPPNAEFDWCETNYEHADWVAEPQNSGTSAVYIVVHLVGVFAHCDIPLRLHVLLAIVSLIGVGSIAFHATLRYSEQLLDELPMYWLICTAACAFYRRSGSGSRYTDAVAVVWSLFLTAVILATDREQFVHNVGRGVLSCSFSGCLVYIFSVGCSAGIEMDEMLGNKSKAGAGLFALAFWAFIFGVVGWIVDILFCSPLQSLPVYLNLHCVWHLGSAYGTYGLFVLLLCHAKLRAGHRATVKWVAGGWLPIQIATA